MLARLRKSTQENEGGFTLIELLVVMIIIGILAAIAIPAFLNQKKKGYDAAVKSDLRQAADEMEASYTDTQTYATTGIAIKKSPGDVVSVAVDTTSGSDGYCVKGSNPKGSAAGGSAGTFYWYDSRLGGFQSTPTATAPASGTCASTTLSAFASL
jgi:type IV pilus assembly protein PilA